MAASNSGDTRPVPDPTALTTDAVNRATDVSRRELAAEKALLEEKIEALKELMLSKMSDRDHALQEQKTTTAEALQKQEALFNTTINAMKDAASDLKDKVIRLESLGLDRLKEFSDYNYGAKQQQTQSFSQTWVIVAIFVSIAAIVVSVLTRLF